MIQRPFRKKAFWVLIIILLALGIFLNYKNTTMPEISENFPVHQINTTNKNKTLVGIISDTHIPRRTENLPKEIEEIFKGVDLIIHGGDIENLETLRELEKIAPVFAVEGNMDPRETKNNLSEGLTLKIYDFQIGIVHSPFPFWLGSHFNWLQEKISKKLAQKQGFDILIFGHTHRPFLKELNYKSVASLPVIASQLNEGKKILLINPGSPTDPFFSEPSVAILKINPQDFEAKIIYLK